MTYIDNDLKDYMVARFSGYDLDDYFICDYCESETPVSFPLWFDCPKCDHDTRSEMCEDCYMMFYHDEYSEYPCSHCGYSYAPLDAELRIGRADDA